MWGARYEERRAVFGLVILIIANGSSIEAKCIQERGGSYTDDELLWSRDTRSIDLSKREEKVKLDLWLPGSVKLSKFVGY